MRQIKSVLDNSGKRPSKVGSLTSGTHPRHGRTWNSGERELTSLDWNSILTESSPPIYHSHHSEHSSYREKLIEHLFIGELLKTSWLGGSLLEVSKPEVDNSGYDIVLEASNVIRHVQLKSSFIGASTSKQNVNVRLAEKPSGCVVWVVFDPKSLELDHFLFYGNGPNQPLTKLLDKKVATHNKRNADGIKAERQNIRELSKSSFIKVASISKLMGKLFG